MFQFFLCCLSTTDGLFLVSRQDSRGNLLYWHALEEQVHTRAAHDDKAGNHAGVDDILGPFLSTGDSNQGKADAAFNGDEGETPWFLKDIEPLFTGYYIFDLKRGRKHTRREFMY